jgi:putative spermidine/putrescine transport system ATP-binding protein
MSFVTLRKLTKSFDSTSVFRDIDLTVEQGEVCTLVGPSGCGKTTLLRAVAGLVVPDLGEIHLAGEPIGHLPPHLRGIAMVFQHYALFPNMTVRQNITFALEQQSLTAPAIAKRVEEMIALMDLGPRAEARPSALSGGQKQRVALARALAVQPRLLLLDEPMSALDAQIRKRLQEEFRRLQSQLGFTAIFVTHDQEEAMMLGDRIAVMLDGRIAQTGRPDEVYRRPTSRAVAGFIGNVNLLEPAEIERVFGVITSKAWAIPPEALSLTPMDGAGVVTGTARISASSFRGTVLRFSLESRGVVLIADVLSRQSQSTPTSGAEVTLYLAPGDFAEV